MGRAGQARRAGLGAGGLAVALTLLLAGCNWASGSAGVSPKGRLDLVVSPLSSLADGVLRVAVAGAKPGSIVTLRVSSTDFRGDAWASEERYLAGQGGTVSLASSAPISGSYSGTVDAMGPWEFMRPVDSADTQPYYAWGWGPQPFTVTASAAGEQSATVVITREMFDPSVTLWDETVSATGFFGQYWAPPVTGSLHPAVLDFGGSEGGLSGALVGGLLAAHGYPTLDLAYFGEPGLPSTLSNIPLEYFVRALTWLGHQPGVDPHRIFVLSASRGSEAALLLAAYFPTLVHGVIASVPSDVSICSYPSCAGPAWTLHGRPLPFTRQGDNPYPSDNPGAVIPVERIQGPILLDCGGADLVWSSCPYAEAIIKRLGQYGAAGRATLESYPSAGHKIGALVPYQPTIGAPLYDA
ncbi:MAG: acyl-CoA thioester hydrolase/BAAT C-terminal domain-containing protein, partial [Mycobacteriales bacterium]